MRDKNPLNSDQLGHKGETRFQEICNDAKLICNPSQTRDRTGWDFIVEFLFDDSETSTLDKRVVPISCHVQVKTMWSSNDTFQMRLSSAERLAKEPKPSFIYVFKVTEDLEFVNAYLIHLLDDNLATILKRLRSEQKKRTAAINSKEISLKASKRGRPLEPTGAALRNAIKEFCGADIKTYISTKNAQLSNLGFWPAPDLDDTDLSESCLPLELHRA